MPRPLSANYKSTLGKVSPEETPKVLLQINHEALETPVRVINDTDDMTSNGDLYVACPFKCVMPDDFENQLPKAKLSVDNVGRDLMYWVETSGGGEGATVRFQQIMRSRPDSVEWEIDLNLYNVTANQMEVGADLGYDNLFSRPAILMQFRPDNSPGMF